MRTTLTLDQDVAAKLRAESRRAARPFREIVNETLRRGLASRRVARQRQSLKIKITARNLGTGSTASHCRRACFLALVRQTAVVGDLGRAPPEEHRGKVGDPGSMAPRLHNQALTVQRIGFITDGEHTMRCSPDRKGQGDQHGSRTGSKSLGES
jgi:hypothetical protein